MSVPYHYRKGVFFLSDRAIMIAMPVLGRSLAALGLLVLACRAQQGGISGNSGVWYYIDAMDIICPGRQGHATLSVTQPAVLSSDPTIFTIFRTTMNPVTLSFIARDATGRTVVDQSAPITLQAVTARPGRRLEEDEEEETKEVAMRGLDSRRRSSFSSSRRRMSSPRRRSTSDSRRRAVLDSRRRTADTSPRRRVMADTRRRSSFFSPRRRRGGGGSFVPNNHYSNPLSPSIGHYGYTNPNYAYHNYGGHTPMSTSYGYTGANAYSSGSGMKIALAGGAGLLAGLATSQLLHHSGGSSFGGYTHAQMMQQDCTYGSWSGNCNSCVSQYGANRCDVSISPNFDATRDDLMSTGFIPTQVSWPLTVTVTSVSGIDFNPASVCPLTPGSAGNPSMARLFLTTTSLGMGSSGGNPGPGYSQPTNYGYNSGQQSNYGSVQSSSSSGSGFFAWLGTVLALCCCCGFCVCCSCASGKKPSKWGFSGDSSSSDSDSESVQMVHHGGHNPYWQGGGQAPAPAQTNTAFMDTAAPGGATWANYCQGPPEVNPSTGFVAGRWGDCLAWAVVYEHQNPGWPQNPTYRDMGPAGTVIQAMLENAEDSDCEDVERAANQLENACAKPTKVHVAGLLDSYMLDITIEVVKARDSTAAGGRDDGETLLSRTMDKTDSKGTGLWSVVEALQAAVPAPSLAASLLARQMSMVRSERLENAAAVPLPEPKLKGTWNSEMEEDLFWAAAFAIIASYAQMFQCLRKMDEVFEFGLNLPATIATFRAGRSVRVLIYESGAPCQSKAPSSEFEAKVASSEFKVQERPIRTSNSQFSDKAKLVFLQTSGNVCREAVASGGMLPVINCRA
ncbi:6-phosphogluconate dehydrogenase, decarboxylating [Symbiodinium microadriaticum]|uniref:phosphogluconate dehydrogenase (NADP(+)-dependent, decarboxylating) n=1 Tax=Symbiodinium microadriaticum TaxID=2951 RepID=A0A1Q9E218_SYMMI|nr:6-phosphogluconate dehydrogenase, decarboxylating [Symbiodinium microadriaticum]